MLQRAGAGMILAAISMFYAGMVERARVQQLNHAQTAVCQSPITESSAWC